MDFYNIMYQQLYDLRDAMVNNNNNMWRDFAVLHEVEDNIRELALHAIASGNYDMETIKQIATDALSTDKLDFTRWYS